MRTALPLLLVTILGCGGAGAGSMVEHQGTIATRPISGTIQYHARMPTPQGASQQVELRPARHVLLYAMDRSNTIVARGAADENGAFHVDVPVTGVVLVVLAYIRYDGHDLAVTADPTGQHPHELRVPIQNVSEPLSIVMRDDDRMGSGGAFHILDTILEGSLAVRRWTSQRLPSLFVYWARGVTTSWSYYRGERPEGSNRFCLELLGGEPNRQATTDTDEHDEAIVLHEFGHFVMDRLSGDSSIGGNHPSGHLIDPGLAWEEGRASWFATAVRRDPRYLDTIGVAPSGSLRVNHDLERGSGGPRGLGSEQGVAEILWDLSDGTEDLPDADSDPVALGPAAVLQAMIAQALQPGSYASIASFLQGLVRAGTAHSEAVKQLLAQGGHPAELLPRGELPWPVDLRAPGRITAKIDGLTDPAPSGGPNRPENGFDAVHAYRVQMPQHGRLTVRLRVFGTGRAADRQDLDVELRDIRGRLLDSARGEVPVEAVSRELSPGWYIVYVRDGGSGNRAGYDLTLTVQPLR